MKPTTRSLGAILGCAAICGSGVLTGQDTGAIDAAATGGAGAEEKFQPKRYGVEHYSKIWAKSPFDFEIRVAEEETEEENPFENLKLAGLVQRGEEYFVSIYDEKGDKTDRIRLQSGDEESEEGFSIVRVERGENFKATKVHVRKGNDVGVIEYDTKRIESKATGAVGGNRAAGGQRNDPNKKQQGGGNQGASNQAGNADNKKTAQEARNEVIKRLLEKAKQNQGNNSNNTNASGQSAGAPDKKRRVVLPPPK